MRRIPVRKNTLKSYLINWDLYLITIPVVLYFIIFKYWPMIGVQIAFKNFSGVKGIWDSPWVGLKHFVRFYNSYMFWPVIQNTLQISLYSLVLGFPIPVLLALMLNECRNMKFKKTVQTITYMPHFLSTVVLVGMILAFLSPQSGLVNSILKLFGYDPIYFMGTARYFKTIYVISGVWQNAGWASIIYMAALAGIDISLYESATIDGASRFKQIIYITLPCLLPTIIVQFILNIGGIMNIGFEKVYLMQNSLNISASEVISTYTYKIGILQTDYSFSTAIGLFNSIINMILLISFNKIIKNISETSLW